MWSRKPSDTIPIYRRTQEPKQSLLGISFAQSQSCVIRSVALDLEDLKQRSIQLSMDYSLTDLLNLVNKDPLTPLSSPKESRQDPISWISNILDWLHSDAGNEVEVLSMALQMIDGDCCLDATSRQSATKFLSSKLAVFPHHRMLWQLYLGLYLRDAAESRPSKMHQAQLCDVMCGPWYRRILMVASISDTPMAKLATLRDGMMALMPGDGVDVPLHVSACCLDLALRMIYIELNTLQNPFNEEVPRFVLSPGGFVVFVLEFLFRFDVGCSIDQPFQLWDGRLDSEASQSVKSLHRSVLCLLPFLTLCLDVWNTAVLHRPHPRLPQAACHPGMETPSSVACVFCCALLCLVVC